MKKVLVVDDDVGLRTLLVEFLSDSGYDVVSAETGRIALRIMQEPGNGVDLVVSDVLMPDMDGIELLTSLRSSHPSLPLIAMTGGGPVMTRELLIKITGSLGAEAVLGKPFSLDELLISVESVLSEAEKSKIEESKTE